MGECGYHPLRFRSFSQFSSIIHVALVFCVGQANFSNLTPHRLFALVDPHPHTLPFAPNYLSQAGVQQHGRAGNHKNSRGEHRRFCWEIPSTPLGSTRYILANTYCTQMLLCVRGQIHFDLQQSSTRCARLLR